MQLTSVGLYLITGVSVGLEFVEDDLLEDTHHIVLDLLIIRVLITFSK